jgi:hypothetical protein
MNNLVSEMAAVRSNNTKLTESHIKLTESHENLVSKMATIELRFLLAQIISVMYTDVFDIARNITHFPRKMSFGEFLKQSEKENGSLRGFLKEALEKIDMSIDDFLSLVQTKRDRNEIAHPPGDIHRLVQELRQSPDVSGGLADAKAILLKHFTRTRTTVAPTVGT